MLNFTSSRVDCSPFGNNVPLWVPERCATIALWQAPHVCSTTRRSLGLAHMPVWAFPASCAVASPRWHRVQVSAFFGCASSIPRWHVVQLVAGAPIAARAPTATETRPVSRAIKVRYLIASVIDEQGESRRGAHDA